MIFMNKMLAERIEDGAVKAAVNIAHSMKGGKPGGRAEIVRVAGGVVVFNPFVPGWSKGIGIGMAGPVCGEDMDLIEKFFRDHGLPGGMYLCPFAHPSLAQELGTRGWRIEGWIQVLVRQLFREDKFKAGDPDISIRKVSRGERKTWASVISEGFSTSGSPYLSEPQLHHNTARAKGIRCYIAFIDDLAVGAASLTVVKSLASMHYASTLPDFRKRGVHISLIRQRLRDAARTGCDLAVLATDLGSPSQRNAERSGFQSAYTQLIMRRDWE